MIYEKRRPVKGGDDQLGGGQQSYPTPSLSATESIPQILRIHFYRDHDLDGAGWCPGLAIAAERDTGPELRRARRG